MRVSDFIRPNSRLRLHDIFGARLAPIAWSLDAPSLGRAPAAGIPRSVVFKGEGVAALGLEASPETRQSCGARSHEMRTSASSA
jgi:hypothetical protein